MADVIARRCGVSLEWRDDVAIILLDNPPVNGLNSSILLRLRTLADRVACGAAIGVVIAGRGRMFSAGADVREFDRYLEERVDPHPILASIESLHKPVVAALHGHCLGGGLEVAMAAHSRVAASDTRLGLPEVRLGLLPGGGGTQRLPRLVGITIAADLIADGAAIGASEAVEIGLVDRTCDGDPVAAGIAFVRELVGSKRGYLPRRTGALPGPLMPPDQRWEEIKKGYADPGPTRRARLAALECVAAAAVLPFEMGLKKEAAAFDDLARSEEAVTLIRQFLEGQPSR